MSVIEGPFSQRPSFIPPSIARQTTWHVYPGRWGQVSGGNWYAFYSNVGPGEYYCYEHPFDPNFWSCYPEACVDQQSDWACRHGMMAGHCEHDCGMPLTRTDIATDEDMKITARKLQDLLSSMENR